MSDENLELVRRIHADWERGDFTDASWAAEDIELVMDGVPPVHVRGVAAMTNAWREWLSGWRDYRVQVEEFHVRGDRVFTLVRFGGRGRASDLPAIPQARGANVWTVRDGKVVRLEAYADGPRALAEFGVD